VPANLYRLPDIAWVVAREFSQFIGHGEHRCHLLADRYVLKLAEVLGNELAQSIRPVGD
jgi:hypothetical protein